MGWLAFALALQGCAAATMPYAETASRPIDPGQGFRQFRVLTLDGVRIPGVLATRVFPQDGRLAVCALYTVDGSLDAAEAIRDALKTRESVLRLAARGDRRTVALQPGFVPVTTRRPAPGEELDGDSHGEPVRCVVTAEPWGADFAGVAPELTVYYVRKRPPGAAGP